MPMTKILIKLHLLYIYIGTSSLKEKEGGGGDKF